MSSVVVSFDTGTQVIGENLSVFGLEGQENIIEVLSNEGESGTSVSIVGGALNDNIDLGVAGGSTVLGLDGHDTVMGSIGNDLIDGGNGDDDLKGGKGADIIMGGFGDDLISGNQGNDIIRGGVGDDSISGGIEDDLLQGGVGDDTIKGGTGDDTIKGGAGDDVIMAGFGADMVSGGAGDDVFEFDASEFKSGAMDAIVDFTEVDDTIRITGVGTQGVSYDSATGMVSIDGAEAIDIGKGKELTEADLGDGEWEIF